ncbi:hypothetical protein [Williamsia sp.]
MEAFESDDDTGGDGSEFDLIAGMPCAGGDFPHIDGRGLVEDLVAAVP